MTFTIYSKTGCSYCEKIKLLMQLEEIRHVVYELDRDFSKEEFYEEFGRGATFPQVSLDNIHLGGCVESIKYMKQRAICCTT
tara:strand:- start:52 stop:297 length:246 start_codon:yes stop_codon:yes gene_type:complete